MEAKTTWTGEVKDEAAAQLRLLTRCVLGYGRTSEERTGRGGLGVLGWGAGGGRGGWYWTGKAWEPSLTGAECPGLH